MASTTLTIALEGEEITLGLFSEAIRRLDGLIKALEAEIDGAPSISWVIDEFHAGSAVATVEGQADAVEQVIARVMDIGTRLASGLPLFQYKKRVADEARGLVGVLDGRVRELRLETPEDSVVIVNPSRNGRPVTTEAWGSISGLVETVTSHRRLRFTLFESLFGRAAYCYMRPGQEEELREIWERMVVVEGPVRRDIETGRPVSVGEIRDVRVLTGKGDFALARGAVHVASGTPNAVDAIRQVRDEWRTAHQHGFSALPRTRHR